MPTPFLSFPLKTIGVTAKLTWISHYSLCACAAGRVASAVEMGIDKDKSFAYSQHLLWGLGEGTSTILVFCAPAIPIMFNSGRRTSKLKTSPPWSTDMQKRQSQHTQRPWPRIAPNSAAVDPYQRMDEESATQLTELGQIHSATSSIPRQDEEHPLHSYLGILKTTEIQITTHTDTSLPIQGHREEEELRHPWTSIRAST